MSDQIYVEDVKIIMYCDSVQGECFARAKNKERKKEKERHMILILTLLLLLPRFYFV
jgi:hypothetical protein